MIYLDYAANHPADPAVVDRFCKTELAFPGYPNSAHPAGRAAAEELRRVTAAVAAPILAEGDLLGLVLFISTSPGAVTGESEFKLAQTIAAFLGRHMES